MTYSSIADARRFVVCHIASHGQELACGKLPSAKKLAGLAGVAENTMLRALRQMQSEGLVQVRPGSGVWICRGPFATAKTAQPATVLRDLVKQRLYSDIITRRFITWPDLPPQKVLCASYGVNPQTLHRALRELVQEGIINRMKRKFISAGIYQRNNSEIVLITRGLGRGDSLGIKDEQHQLVRIFEQSCLDREIVPVPVSYYFEGADLCGLETLRKVLRNRMRVIGAVLFTGGMSSDALAEILLQFRKKQLPLSVLDTAGTFSEPLIHGTQQVRCFAPAFNLEPGYCMADYLLAKGHRNVLFVDFPGSPVWSVRRYEALRKRFTALGADASVTRVGLEIRDGGGAIGTRGNATNETTAVAVDSFTQDVQSAMSLLNLADNRREAGTGLLGAYATFLGQALGEMREYASLLHTVKKAMGTMPANRVPYTAVVGANDMVALCALEVVNKSIAVAGFDDSSQALAHDLTSYNFSMIKVIGHMIEHVVRPKSFSAVYPHLYVSLPGMIIERGSSRKS